MVDYNRYFYLSGVLTLLVVMAIFLVFYFFILVQIKKMHYSMHEDAVVVVSLEDKKVEKKAPKDLSKPIETKAPEEVVEKKESVEDLFGDLKSDKIVYSKKSVEDKRVEVDQEVLRKLQKKHSIKIDQKIEKRELNIDVQKSEIDQSMAQEHKNKAGIKDEYITRINAILTQRWQNTSDTQGAYYKAVVRIVISATGRMDFRVLIWSADDAFNQQLKSFLEFQRTQAFDAPEDQKSVTLEVNFISKEE